MSVRILHVFELYGLPLIVSSLCIALSPSPKVISHKVAWRVLCVLDSGVVGGWSRGVETKWLKYEAGKPID